MKCNNCQQEVSQNSVSCEKCGNPFKKNKAPLYIGLIIGVAVIAVIAILSILNFTGDAYKKQINIGYDLLEEGKYEEAVLAFDKAIEIDEKRPEGYMGKAESLAHDPEMTPEKAEAIAEVLNVGYEKTGDKKVLEHKKSVGRILQDNGFDVEAGIIAAINSNPKGSKTVSEKTVASSYLEILQELVDSYGVADRGDFAIDGVSYASLYDFDADGSQELFVMYGHNSDDDSGYKLVYDVYGYKDGDAYLLAQENASSSFELSYNINISSVDGKKYVVTSDDAVCDSTYFIRTKEGDNWVTKELYSYSAEFDFDSRYDHDIYKLDGVEITEEEYNAELDKLAPHSESAYLDLNEDTVTPLLEKLKAGNLQ